MTPSRSSSERLQYLDWVRGAAAVTMLQGHVFDSFTRNDLRADGAFVYSQFLGGMPPAIFLLLTGVTFAFLMDSNERKGIAPGMRWLTALKRSGYLFALAFAFRLQLWLFSQPAPWMDLFKVDILNCMGFAMVILSPMALFKTTERIRLCAVLGVAIAFASPLVSQVNWQFVPEHLRHYFVPDYRFFGLFPWGAFLAFGMSAGSMIRRIPEEGIERAMQWGALAGGAIILVSQHFSSLPYSIYSKSDYWLNSPALVLTKLGVVLLILALGFAWTRYGAGTGWSWVRQFGTTSLLVYWVHIELVYGRWFPTFKNSLSVPETIVAAICVILMMLGLSLIRTNYTRLGGLAANMRLWPSPRPAQGD